MELETSHLSSPDEFERATMASSLLMSSPPGELNDCFQDIRVIVSNDDALKQVVGQPLLNYMKDNYETIELPIDGLKVILSEFNQLSEGKFYDPQTKIIFTYDPLSQMTTVLNETYTDVFFEGDRKSLETVALEYVSKHYSTGTVGVYDQSGDISLIISANKLSPQNFWNGGWKSLWQLKNGSKSLKGTLTAQVHYYEDGNVQLLAKKELELETSKEEFKEWGEEVVELIAKAESAFQSSLTQAYGQLAEQTFKNLRRVLPVTKNKIEWEKIFAYRVGSELPVK